ncbi:MAG: TolC family protein, partial [Proteobacteria bacterium]
RADVASLKTRAEIGARVVNDVRWQFLPSINVASTLSTTSQDTGALPRTLWNVQALLTVPIWDGGARYGNLRDTNAQLDQALMRLEAQRRKATIEAVQALRGVAVSENNLRVSEKTRDLALENDRLTRASYTEGRGTSLELVTSATTLRQSEINLAVREFELVRARITAAIVLSTCDV